MTGGLGLTLIVALVAALILGAVALRLRLPPLIGYIAAGLAVGPATPGLVADQEQVLALAEIGVALLMFSIGLRFSFAELLSVGRTVLVGAPLQMAATVGIGIVFGLAVGWSPLEGAFVGALTAVSSSIVLVKVAGETGIRGTVHGRLAFAWSIVQDVVTVALVVVLAAFAGNEQGSLVAVLRSTALAVAFIAAVAFGGARVFPVLLGRIARLRSRELFVIAVAALAIGVSFSATTVGVSIALGAFVAGLALADSDLTASVLGEIVPLRELFATFFFVSIGMLVDPPAIVAGLPIALLVLGMIVLVKGALISGVNRIGGYAPGTALVAGSLMAQSGEFSFVLATVGVEAGAISRETFSLAMGAVVASIVLAEPLFRGARLLAPRLDRSRSAQLAAEVAPTIAGLRRHAVILGYGAVGRTVARMLAGRRFPYVAIDADYRLAREASSHGIPVLFGDAGNPDILEAASVEHALILVVAVPDPLAARQSVDYALRRNPRIEVAARAHSESEEAYLKSRGVSRVVVGEREIGNQLVHHALRRFGVSEREVEALLRARRER